METIKKKKKKKNDPDVESTAGSVKTKAPKEEKKCIACDGTPPDTHFQGNCSLCMPHEAARIEAYPHMDAKEFGKAFKKSSKFREGVANVMTLINAQPGVNADTENPEVFAVSSGSGGCTGGVNEDEEVFIDVFDEVEGHSLSKFRKLNHGVNPWDVPPPLGPVRPYEITDVKGRKRHYFLSRPDKVDSIKLRVVRRNRIGKKSRKGCLRSQQKRLSRTKDFAKTLNNGRI